jgi:serine/threonine protein kinase
MNVTVRADRTPRETASRIGARRSGVSSPPPTYRTQPLSDGPPDEDLTGCTVDHYVILALIAAGGQARVYRGRDTRLQRDVAIKVGRIPKVAAGPSVADEAMTLSRLNHPNVAGIYDFITRRSRGFIVMEFVPGATLRAILAGGPLPPSEVVRIGADIARGLAAAHAAHVVHGDVKPSNLKITSSGDVKILDFGAATMMPSGSLVHDRTRTSSTLSIIGTVPYMAPEQLSGDGADGRTDIFSVGAVLYEMATGQRAFPQRDLGRLVEAIQHERPIRPTALNPLLPPAVERIITRAMQKNPGARQRSATELAESLEALMADARPSTSRQAAPRRSSRLGPPAGDAALATVHPLTPHEAPRDFTARGCALR